MANGWARIIGVQASTDPYARGYREVLEHAGVRPEMLDRFAPSELNRTHVLLLMGNGHLSESNAEVIRQWVHAGGVLICSGGAWGLESVLGFPQKGRRRSNARVRRAANDRLWPEDVEYARCFGVTTYPASSGEVIATVGQEVAVSRRVLGLGIAIFLGAHLGQNLALMQMGRAVECDGIGPEDDSVQLDDGILRAEDGIPLPFSDRAKEGHFATADADVHREVLMRAFFQGLEHTCTAPLPWFWPNHAPGVGVLSLECENDDINPVVAVHRVLSMYGAPAVWNIRLPGYPNEVYRTLRAREHEVGLLYQDEEFHDDRLRSQITQLARHASEPQLDCTRPLDGGWRGLSRFYDLCESAGARISMAKGGRQTGTQGFAFGSCHPYFPLRRDGQPGLVAELPYALFRPGAIASDAMVDSTLAQTLARHGCLGVVTPPSAFTVREELDSLRRLFSEAKRLHVPFLLPRDIYRYERGRRLVRLHTRNIDGELILTVSSEVDLPRFSVLLPGARGRTQLNGKEWLSFSVMRYGTECLALSFDLEAKRQVEVRVQTQGIVQVA